VQMHTGSATRTTATESDEFRDANNNMLLYVRICRNSSIHLYGIAIGSMLICSASTIMYIASGILGVPKNWLAAPTES